MSDSASEMPAAAPEVVRFETRDGLELEGGARERLRLFLGATATFLINR